MGFAIRHAHQPAEEEQEYPKETFASDIGPLGHLRLSREILEREFRFDIKHVARQSNGAGVRRIVPRDDALKLHPLSVFFGDRTEGRSHTCGFFVKDLILNNDDAPLSDVFVGETKDIVNRSVNHDLALISHGWLQCDFSRFATIAAEKESAGLSNQFMVERLTKRDPNQRVHFRGVAKAYVQRER